MWCLETGKGRSRRQFIVLKFTEAKSSSPADSGQYSDYYTKKEIRIELKSPCKQWRGSPRLTLFRAGGGIYAPPTTFRQFSPDVLIRGGSDYTLNSSFVIAEHMKLVPGQKNFPTARESPPKSAG